MANTIQKLTDKCNTWEDKHRATPSPYIYGEWMKAKKKLNTAIDKATKKFKQTHKTPTSNPNHA